MPHQRARFVAGIRVTGLWTLTSRILGMVRDIATAALFGLAGGGVMDAFVIAFRLPDLFRRLFSEGALSASYLPILSARLQRDRTAAWQLASVLFTWLGIILAGLVVIAEFACVALWLVAGSDPHVALVAGLSAVMLPYLMLICLAAQVSATLHALDHFSLPAFVPILLNLCWIGGALGIAPLWDDNPVAQAYVLATCVLVGGTLQLATQLPMLRRLGFRFHYNLSASRSAIRHVIIALVPMLIGLAATQFNTLVDSLTAWCFSAPDTTTRIDWLSAHVTYPLQTGATAAIYYSERICQLPVGVLGIAVATVIFPLLSRHAALGDRKRLSVDLTLGLQLVLFLAIPATAGLVLLAQPVATLLFQHGEFTTADAARTGVMIMCYGYGVWAYCSLPVIVRGFFAVNDYATPARIAVWTVVLNVVLNFALIWTCSEAGLALATATASAFQVLVLTTQFARRHGALDWASLAATLARSTAAAAVMTTVGWIILCGLTALPGWWGELLRVVLPVLACLAVYFAVHAAMGGREGRLLFRRTPQNTEPADSL